jgi:outer membrane immunogenic protein
MAGLTLARRKLSAGISAVGNLMRSRLLLVAIIAAAATPAMAADLAVPPAYKASPPIAAPTWAGFYIGANAGYGTGSWDGSQSFPSNAAGYGVGGPLDTSIYSVGNTGFLGGGQVGYNWQFGRVVAGVEADFDWSNVSGSVAGLEPFGPGGLKAATNQPLWNFDSKMNWLSTYRARLGYDANGTLIYGTGGLALASFSESHTITDSGFGQYCGAANATCNPASKDQTKLGWTIGAGIEQALGGGWSAKAEYQYTSFAGVGGTMDWNDPTLGGNPACPAQCPSTDGFKGDFNIHTFRGGINYRF